MKPEDCREFIKICFKRLQSSAWDYELATKELMRLIESEKTIWKKQDEEQHSVFFGRTYL